MPHTNYPLSADGLVLPLLIGVKGQTTAQQLAAGQPPTPPVLVNGLVDTGSDVTCVASRVIQHLGLPIYQHTTTHTVAGTVQVQLFEVSLSIPRTAGAGGWVFTLDRLVVMELSNPPDAAEVILGLDVLRQLLLVFDGPAGAFTLAD